MPRSTRVIVKQQQKKKKKPAKQKTLRRAPGVRVIRTTDLNWPPPSHVCINRWVALSLAPLCQYHVHLLLSYRFFSRVKDRRRRRRTETVRGGPATAAAARSLAGVTPAKEALAACLPDCRPSPGQRQNKRSGGTDRDWREGSLPLSRRLPRAQPWTETNQQRKRRRQKHSTKQF